MREVDRVQHDVHLVVQDRVDIDRGIEIEQRRRRAGHVRDEHLADAPLGAQTGAGRHNLV